MKYKNFIILLALICVWTSFFWVYKYFFWWLLKENLSLTLEQIAWYLALGSFFAYLFWSFIYTLLKEQWSVICASFWVIMILSLWYLKWFTSIDSIAIMSIWVWFFYGYWGVLKNIVISQEIEYTGKSDTFINGFANIAFFVSIIIGSIAWWKLAESLHTDGVFWIFIIMVFAILLWTSSKFQRYKNTLEELYKKLFSKLPHRYQVQCSYHAYIVYVLGSCYDTFSKVHRIQRDASVKNWITSKFFASLLCYLNDTGKSSHYENT